MENNNKSKITISNILLIVAIIIILIMGYIIFKMDRFSQGLNDEVQDLKAQVSSLNEVTKVENAEKQTSNSKIVANQVESVNVEFTIDEARTAIDDYFTVFSSLKSSPRGLLVQLGYKGFGEYDEERTGFYNTNIEFDDFKSKMLNYISTDSFTKKFENPNVDPNSIYSDLKNENGMLYIRDTFSNGLTTKVTDIVKLGTNKYAAKVIIVDPEAVVGVDIDSYIGTNNERSYNFTVESYNGKCVIDTCDW